MVAVVSVSWQHIKWIQVGSQSRSMSIESFQHCSIIHLSTVDLHIHYNKASEWYFITFNLTLTTNSIMMNTQYSALFNRNVLNVLWYTYDVEGQDIPVWRNLNVKPLINLGIRQFKTVWAAAIDTIWLPYSFYWSNSTFVCCIHYCIICLVFLCCTVLSGRRFEGGFLIT